MTFEEWYEKTCKFTDEYEIDSYSMARMAWNAAKEDSKSVTKAYFKEEYHGGLDFSHWVLAPLNRGDKQWHFSSKQEAEKWAIENGYRVEGS